MRLRFDEWRSRFGLDEDDVDLVVGGVDVREASTCAGFGLRPRIVIPPALTHLERSASFDAIVCHELGHVARRDTTWVGLVQALRWLVVPVTAVVYLRDLLFGTGEDTLAELAVGSARGLGVALLLFLLAGVLLRARELDADAAAVAAGRRRELDRLLREYQQRDIRLGRWPRARALLATHPSPAQRSRAIAAEGRSPQRMLLFVRAAAIAGAVAPLSWVVRQASLSLLYGGNSQPALVLGAVVVGAVIPFVVPLPGRGQTESDELEAVPWSTARLLLAAGAFVGFTAGSLAMPGLQMLDVAPTGITLVDGLWPGAAALTGSALICAGTACLCASLAAWSMRLRTPGIVTRGLMMTLAVSVSTTSVWVITWFGLGNWQPGSLYMITSDAASPWVVMSLMALLPLGFLPILGLGIACFRHGFRAALRRAVRVLWLPIAIGAVAGGVFLVWMLIWQIADPSSENDAAAIAAATNRYFRGFVAGLILGVVAFALSRPHTKTGTVRAATNALVAGGVAGLISIATVAAFTAVRISSWYTIKTFLVNTTFWIVFLLPFLALLATLAPHHRLRAMISTWSRRTWPSNRSVAVRVSWNTAILVAVAGLATMTHVAVPDVFDAADFALSPDPLPPDRKPLAAIPPGDRIDLRRPLTQAEARRVSDAAGAVLSMEWKPQTVEPDTARSRVKPSRCQPFEDNKPWAVPPTPAREEQRDFATFTPDGDDWALSRLLRINVSSYRNLVGADQVTQVEPSCKRFIIGELSIAMRPTPDVPVPGAARTWRNRATWTQEVNGRDTAVDYRILMIDTGYTTIALDLYALDDTTADWKLLDRAADQVIATLDRIPPSTSRDDR
ncbi:MAG: M48 family metalloprotease [Nocardioides sp.]